MIMKFCLTILFLLSIRVSFAQSDWQFKPYVVVNDTIYEDLKLPVFIMDSTLFIRNSEGQVLTFPSSNVDYISKRCFYKRITKSNRKYLAKSGNTLGYLSFVQFMGGTAIVGNEIVEIWIEHSYYGSPVALMSGVTFFIVPSVIIVHKLMLRKKMNRMIIESKGMKFL
jgi:hypothetical protein